jgi:hypothetical protein
MTQSQSSKSSAKENKYSKMMNEMKQLVSNQYDQSYSEEESEPRRFKESNSQKYQDSRSQRESGQKSEEYSMLSSLKKSESTKGLFRESELGTGGH